MVQVDIIWGYAFGASFAGAAATELAAEPKPFRTRTYVFLLTFLSIFFAPSGLYLLWQFPSWETMQVASTLEDLPAWLVMLFAVTNITQGMVGYWVGYKLIRSGDEYGAHVNWMAAWILFWFVLVCGWDTTGWQRFLYDRSIVNGEAWSLGKHLDVLFFTGDVFLALFVMGVFFVPMLFWGLVGSRYQPSATKPAPTLGASLFDVLLYLILMFGVCLALAIVAALMVMGIASAVGSILVGYIVGLALAVGLGYALLFRRGRPMELLTKHLRR